MQTPTDTYTPTQTPTMTRTPTQMPTPTFTPTVIPSPMVIQPLLSPSYSSTCGSPPSNWWKNPNGYTGYNSTAMFLTMNAQSSAQSTNSAKWTPNVPLSGQYKVEVFIAYHPSLKWPCTNVSIYGDSSSAKYEVHHASGTNTVTVNQVPLDNAWTSLGNFRFNTGTTGYVKLSDVTGESFSTRFVSFNVIRFTWVGP
jgi:hypothetical protein